ncbi:SusC/RagA family TonB-linked outer membrane protein [Gabonibacter massiliensis]|uniref:SusC/RagA family TonB-linked outer membrane protein n=1 Tax=Gabonibacter massiliensis TaxID=1720195 RepID=UPI00073E8CCD|nr:SusC/RagA family TonB-linked outer membrane protein [Gabonibacter massiliensis]
MNKVLYLILLLQFVSCFTFAQARHPANIRISADFKDTPILKVLEEIKQKSGISFLCNHEQVRELPPVTKRFRSETIENILKFCLKDSGLDFQFVNRVIIITPMEPEMIKKMEISGRVYDISGLPLPGVTVKLDGTVVGVSTDREGRFRLDIYPREAGVLLFSFVGMKPRRIPIIQGRTTGISVFLEDDPELIDEVVITGYSNYAKGSFTGNSTTISGDKLLRVSKTNLLSAIQTFEPSFRIHGNNEWGSDPNTLPELYVRGRSGIGVTELSKEDLTKSALENNSNLPTFILDGFQIDIQKVYDMDMDRVESITILKDAAATAMYGSRAANGVIVITTRGIRPGKLHVGYRMNGEVAFPDLSDYNLMHAAEKIETERLAGLFEPDNASSEVAGLAEYNSKLKQLAKGVDTYWLSKPVRAVFNHKHSLVVEGETGNLRVGVDFLYHQQNGVMKGSFRTRTGGGLNLDFRYRSLQLRNRISYYAVRSEDSPYGVFSDYTKQLPYDEYRDDKGDDLPYLQNWHSGPLKLNPLYEAGLKSFAYSNYDQWINNFDINWYVNDYLSFKGGISVSHRTSEREEFTDPRSLKPVNLESTLKGYLDIRKGKAPEWNTNALVTYDRSVGVHYIHMTVGINIRSSRTEYISSAYRGFASGDLHSPNYAMEVVVKPTLGEVTKRLLGVFGSLNYAYRSIYLFDVAGRVDGSSEFGKNRRFAPFWSLGAGINLHHCSFMKKWSAVDRLKVRMSYGQTGKVDFPAYCAISTYEVTLDDLYKTGSGVLMKTLGNPNLKWERTNTMDIGMELELFKGVLACNLSYYDSRTRDLITDVTIAASSGFPSYKDNLGEVRNRGIELSLSGNLINKSDIHLNVYGNLSHNRNRIMKISDALREYNRKVDGYYGDYHEGLSDLKYTRPLLKYVEGGSLTAIWGMRSLGIDPSTGKELFLGRQGTMTQEWKSGEQVVIGDYEPDVRGAFGFNVKYKGWTLFASFLYEFGGQRYNETLVRKVENVDIAEENADRRVLLERWRKPGDKTFLKDIRNRELTRPTSRFCQDYNVLSWDAVSLGYDLDRIGTERLGIETMRLEWSMNDVFRFSSIKEERGISYPFARNMSLTLKISF